MRRLGTILRAARRYPGRWLSLLRGRRHPFPIWGIAMAFEEPVEPWEL